MVGHSIRNSRDSIHPEIYALLWVTRQCEARISDFLLSRDLPEGSIQRGMHLTVYYARRLLPGLGRTPAPRPVSISADAAETRFMVLAPGGENPQPGLDPARRSVGIRLTRRNRAVDEIQLLRREMLQLETPEIVGRRKPSTAWTNCFGARHFQPHIKLLRPGNGIGRDLRMIGDEFRKQIESIEFGKYEVVLRTARRSSNSIAGRSKSGI